MYLFYKKTLFVSSMKKIIYILLLFILGNLTLHSQFSEKKERKRMWRKSARAKKHGKNREAFNPYLKKKNKDKPSSKAKREDEKAIRKMKKDFKRQNRKHRIKA